MSLQNSSSDKIQVIRTQPDQSLGCSIIDKDGREVLVDQSSNGLNPRRLTPRECARIQGFPEWFDLSAASDTQLYKQFGNSVSVPVIRAIAGAMVRYWDVVTQTERDLAIG